MRNLSFNGYKWDKKYFIAAAVTLCCAIISGIVLFKLGDLSIYFVNFANDYIYFVFNFKNGSIIFPHILSELFYLYLFFLIAYCTRMKYFTLVLVFVRGMLFTVYACILLCATAFGGISVALIVFIPAGLISLICCVFVSDVCRFVNKRYVLFMPAVLAVANTLVLLVLINVVFKVIIVIV